MKDITNPKLLWLKSGLFLIIGVVSATLLLIAVPTLKTTLLLGLTIWGFCRAYYFAFYVIEKYTDSEYRFSGLISFWRYILSQKYKS